MTQHRLTPVTEACVVCRSETATLELRGRDLRHGLGDVFEVVKCQGCGLVRTSPRLDDLSAYYPESYQNHAAREGMAERVSVGVLKRSLSSKGLLGRSLTRLFAAADLGGSLESGESLLDVGSGSGHVVRALRSAGIDAWGLEPSERAVETARQAGLETVVLGVLDESTIKAAEGLRGRTWDVIRFYHTLEHIGDPVAALRYAADLLTSTGHIVIVVPNFNGLGRRVFDNSWDGLELPRHVHHFSRESLASVFSRAGLTLTSLHTVAIPGVLPGSLAAWRRNGRPRREFLASAPVQAALLPLELAAALAGAGEGLVGVGIRSERHPASDV